MHTDLLQKTGDLVCPLQVINLSNDQHIELPRNYVVAFAQKDDVEIESCFSIDNVDPTPRHWVSQRPQQPIAEIVEIVNVDLQEAMITEQRTVRVDLIETNTDLHKILTSASNFIKSPAEVEAHRKVELKDKVITEEAKVKFDKLCDKFQDIISQGSDDIGKTLLIEMDIDTGNSPPPLLQDLIPYH